MGKPLKRDETTVQMVAITLLLTVVIYASYYHFDARLKIHKNDKKHRKQIEKRVGFKVSDKDWREFTQAPGERYKFTPGSENDPRAKIYRKWRNEQEKNK